MIPKIVHLRNRKSRNNLFLMMGLNSNNDFNQWDLDSLKFDGNIFGLQWDSYWAEWDLLKNRQFTEINLGFISNYVQVCKNADKVGEYLSPSFVKYRNDNNFVFAHSMGTRVAYSVSHYLPTEVSIKQTFLFNGALPYSEERFNFLAHVNRSSQVFNCFNPLDPVLLNLALIRQLLKTNKIKFPPTIYADILTFFDPIGLKEVDTVSHNLPLSNVQLVSHSIAENFSKVLNFNIEKNIFNIIKEGNIPVSTNETPKSPIRSDMTSKIDEIDKQADALIFKYAVIAAAANLANLIPGTNVLIDAVFDSLAQYKMLTDLVALYHLDRKTLSITRMLLAIADELALKKATKWVIDFIPVLGKFASTLLEFAYTYAIGMAIKQLFRQSLLSGKPVDESTIPAFVKNAWDEALDYVKKHWKNVLKSEKIILTQYKVDLERIATEIKDTNIKKDEVMIRNIEVLQEIFHEFKAQKVTTEDLLAELDNIATEIGEPSAELFKSAILMKKMRGEEIDPADIALFELLEKNHFDGLIKGLLPPHENK